MKASYIIAAAATLVLALPAYVDAAATATRPATVVGATTLYARDVASTVTVSAAATITLTNMAYRHPETVQAILKVSRAGTYEIRDRCKPYTLTHTWIVTVNGREVARARLKCR